MVWALDMLRSRFLSPGAVSGDSFVFFLERNGAHRTRRSTPS
jgi:hypothetical protein